MFARTRYLFDSFALSQNSFQYTPEWKAMDVLVFSFLRGLGIKAMQVSECTGGGKVKHVFPVRSATETPAASVSTSQPCDG